MEDERFDTLVIAERDEKLAELQIPFFNRMDDDMPGYPQASSEQPNVGSEGKGLYYNRGHNLEIRNGPSAFMSNPLYGVIDKNLEVTRKRTPEDDVKNAATPPSETLIPCKQSRMTDFVHEDVRRILTLFTLVRRCMMFYFGRCCTDRLFKDPNKWTLDGNDVVLTLRFCDQCTKGNREMAETYLKSFVWGSPSTGGPLPKRNKKLFGLWRLFRLKYTLALHPCHQCQERLRETAVVYRDAEGDTVVRYRMCRKCAEGHMEMTQLYNDNFAPQFEDEM